MIVASIVAALTWRLSVLVPQALWQHQASSKSWAVCTPTPPIKPTLANSGGKRPKGKKGNTPDEHSEPLAYSGISIGLVMYILKKKNEEIWLGVSDAGHTDNKV